MAGSGGWREISPWLANNCGLPFFCLVSVPPLALLWIGHDLGAPWKSGPRQPKFIFCASGGALNLTKTKNLLAATFLQMYDPTCLTLLLEHLHMHSGIIFWDT
jgi:hypothetical protein